MEHERTVGIQDALGLARGAGGVAHCCSRTFVGIRNPAQRFSIVEQRLVFEIPRRHGLCGADHNRAIDPGSRGHLLPERQQLLVDKHDAIVRIVDDEGELVGVEAEVERVQHGACQRDTEVRLEMLEMVPAECGHPVARTDVETQKGAGQTSRPSAEVGVRVAMQRPVRAACHHVAARKYLLRVAEDRRQRERKVHHQTVHGAGL